MRKLSLPIQERPPAVWAAAVVALALALPAATRAAESPSVNGSSVEPTCRRIAGKLASVGIEECLAAGLETSQGRSVSGTPILVRELPPSPARAPRGRVLLVGGIHGDEYSSVSIVFKWLGLLADSHSGLFHWRVVPLLNPDGLLRPRAQRMNANGVDLNRNFPCANWQEETRDYWVRRTRRDERRYPGPGPLSEPESRWLAEQIEQFDPDVIVSVHAPYSVVDFDGPDEPPSKLGSLHLKLLGTYPGSLGRYAGVARGIPVVTVELPRAGIMPSAEEQVSIWKDLVRWLVRRLPAARTVTKRATREVPVRRVVTSQLPPS